MEEKKKPYNELDENMKKSFERVEELRKGRTLGDIPLNDEYWVALKNHQKHHGK